MPTISESVWRELESKRKDIIDDFANGINTQPVMEARLYAIGLRNQDLGASIKEAQYAKLEKYAKRPEPSNVLVLERSGKATTLRFNDYHNAAFACRMLRRVPGVIFANVVHGEGHDLKVINPANESFVSDMLRLM